MTSDSLILPQAIGVPFVAGLVLLVKGREMAPWLARAVAWVGFLVPALTALCAWWIFSMHPAGTPIFEQSMTAATPTQLLWRTPEMLFPFERDIGLGFLGLTLKLGLNGLSLPMFVLAGIVGLAAGIYAMNTSVDRPQAYWGLLLFIVSGAMGVFASLNLFYFYFFHEFALIPTFILIGWWGGPGGRAAAMEMTIYLTLGAMLSLLGLLALFFKSGAHSFDLVSMHAWTLPATATVPSGHKIFGLLLFGFGILVSLWPFHSWAPTGYAAAPTPAAMLHAGVLKKFGLYGLLQIAVPLLPGEMAGWSHLLAWLALGNVVVIGLVTLAQRDLKVMLGYSSVMHMGYIFLGIVCVSAMGAGGAVLLMFAHGLSVAALFLLSDAVFQRTRTYDFGAMGGLCKKAPVLSAFFVAATFAGIGLPGFANFWGEFGVFVALWKFSPWMTAAAALGVVISAIYGLRAVSRIFYGEPSPAFQTLFDQPVADLRPGERWPAIILLGALLLVGFWPGLLSRGINESLPTAYQDLRPSGHYVLTLNFISETTAAPTPAAPPAAPKP
ncbi:MAG TPA: NADH-quinone oxidoreductase subunit M [Opitutales bacterium]|nr:NADH-quinone oxidoreductase subunit M [Opitutales bacterium]